MMSKENYNVVGVMSGTSLDGIDLAEIKFTLSNSKWQFEIGRCETIPYNEQWINRPQAAAGYDEAALQNLNSGYSPLLGTIIKRFLAESGTMEAVCSHGHTTLHQPQRGYTLQIGNLP